MLRHHGSVETSCQVTIGGSRKAPLAEVQRKGPCDAIVIHDARRGITTVGLVNKVAAPLGGDRQTWSISIQSGFVVVTEPGCAVARQSRGVAIVRNSIEVASGATCLWLPKPLLLGPGAALRMATTACVARGGSLLVLEAFGLCGGTGDKDWATVSLVALTELHTDQGLLWWDALRVRRGTRRGAAQFVDGVWVTDRHIDPGPIKASIRFVGTLVGASQIASHAGVIRCLLDPSHDARVICERLAEAWLEQGDGQID